MPSVPVSFREAKEPDDSGQPCLKSLIKEKGKKGKAKKMQKANCEEKAKAQKERRYAKRGVVKAPRRTQFLVVRVTNINKIFPKRNFKTKRRLLFKIPT